MVKQCKWSILLIFALLPGALYAGNEGGHGGGGIVCGNADGSLQSVELLDLWEQARVAGSQGTSWLNGLSEDQIVARIIGRLRQASPELAGQVTLQLGRLRLQAAPADIEMTPPSDVGIRTLPRLPHNCSLKAIAKYWDRGEVLYTDQELYGALTVLQKTALKLHEAIYRQWRRLPVGVADSRKVRALIGALFDQAPFVVTAPDAARDRALFECNAGADYQFLVVNGPSIGASPMELHMTRIAGRVPLGQAIVTLTDSNQILIPGANHQEDAPRNFAQRLSQQFLRSEYTVRSGTNPSSISGANYRFSTWLGVSSQFDPVSILMFLGGDHPIENSGNGRTYRVRANGDFTIRPGIYPRELSDYFQGWGGELECRPLQRPNQTGY